ncbi:MAG TPA: helix-turn-helix transcriptional regulator [Polyangiaceae bacterium]
MAKKAGESPSTRLRQVIEEKGLQIDAFAALLGEKAQRVRDVLRGKQRIPAPMLAKMESHGFDVSYVLNGDGGRVVVTDHIEAAEFLRTGQVARLVNREIEFLNNYRRCPEPKKLALEETAAAFAQLSGGKS